MAVASATRNCDATSSIDQLGERGSDLPATRLLLDDFGASDRFKRATLGVEAHVLQPVDTRT